MLAGSIDPYSKDGTIHCVPAAEPPPSTVSKRLLWAPAASVKVTVVLLSAVTLPRLYVCAAPCANQIAAESTTSVAVTGLPSDHLASGWRCTVSWVPLALRLQVEARRGSAWLGLAEFPAFQASCMASNVGSTLFVTLNGFIGAPGVMTVV